MKKWTVQDRYGNTIYLTEERWYHILDSCPELEPLFGKFLFVVTGWAKYIIPKR
jgi:hypothetical protein